MKRPSIVMAALGLPLSALTVMPFFADHGRLLEITCHFIPVYGVLALTYFCLAIAARRPLFISLALLLVAINTMRLAPLYAAEGILSLNQDQNLRVLHLNLWGPKNKHPQKIFEQVDQQEPQVIALSEIDQTWLERLKVLDEKYPYHLATTNCGGVGLWSKYPLDNARVQFFISSFNTNKRPRISASVCLPDGKKVALILVHPPVPVGQLKNFKARNEEFKTIAEQARSLPRPCFLIGDLNCSPWSPYFDELAQQANLKDSARGFGLAPTWPDIFPLRPMIPIDHCLVSSGIKVQKRSVLDSAGSDHRPVLLDLLL